MEMKESTKGEEIPMGASAAAVATVGMDNRAYVNVTEPEDYRYLSPLYTRSGHHPDKNMNGKPGSLNVELRKGVGDLEHVHIEGVPGSPGSPSKMYDYADYGHQYEELPGGRKSIAKCNMDSGLDSRSEYQSSGGATDIVSETGDMANIINEKSQQAYLQGKMNHTKSSIYSIQDFMNHRDTSRLLASRKRVNPLYDQMNQSMPSIYNKQVSKTSGAGAGGGRDEGLRRQVRCLKCALVVIVVVCLAALSISLYAVVSKHTQDTDSELTPMIDRLKQDYDRMEDLMSSFQDNDTMQILSGLLKKVNSLEANVSTELARLKGQTNRADGDIQQVAQDLAQTHSNISDVISFLNMTLQLQLHNVSKQPGPVGPQGVANFSLCSYYNVSNNAAASPNFASYSPWAPTETDLETKVALFGACTVDGGEASLLETHAITHQHVQFRCKCSGVVSGKNRRVCYIHIFSCPRES